LTVDPSALSPAAPASAATAAEPTAAEPPSGEVAKIETAAAEKPNADVEPPSVGPESTSVDAGIAKTGVEETAATEGDKIAPSLARLEADLAAPEAKSHMMEKLAYWAVGGLIILLMIAASLLLVWRKRANATKAQVKSETQPAGLAVRAQTSQAHSTEPLEERSAPDSAAVSRGAAVADAIRFQNGSEQKQNIVNKNRGQKPEQQLVAVNDKNNETAQPPSANTTSCVHCNREISVDDKFCLHCGAAVAPKVAAATTRLCSSCRQEIGASDRFCRHCGASSMAVVAPSMTANAGSA
jgi:hypothetical protein